jgi:hypothetical protein
MPNSGTVTAGSVALASQYNNLRSDVLDASTGHTHTGASENGAQIEGTAIKSTGATSGYVLTAGAGGTTTTWAAVGGPTVSAVYGTAAFSTATNNGGTPVSYQATPSNVAWRYTTTGGGTVVVGVSTPDTAATGGHIISVYTTGGTTYTGGTTWAPTAAGSALYFASGQGFATATSQGFLIRELSKTGTTLTTTIRKFTTAMANSWNTQLFTGTVASGAVSDGGPFAQYNTYGGYAAGRWASGPGIWYGGDYRDAAIFSTAGTTQICSMWIINDASGSAYSAPFGSATSGNGAHIRCSVFIPSATAATSGTIHAWGVNNTSARYVTYAVGSASISAVATADYTYTGPTYSQMSYFNYPIVGKLITAIWIESASRMVAIGTEAIVFTDRTVGTALASVDDYGYTDEIGSNFFQNPDCNFDLTTGYHMLASDNVAVAGSYDELFAPLSNWLGLPSAYAGYGAICGPGSATFLIASNTSGAVRRWDLAGIAKVTLDASSTANRWFTLSGGNGWEHARILSVNGGGSAAMISSRSDNAVPDLPVSFIAQGTAPVTVNIAPGRDSNSSAGYGLSASAPAAVQVIGGTAIVKATKVNLA